MSDNVAVLSLLAGTPILLILVLMLGFRWSAMRAGLVGFAGSLLIAVVAFGFGTRVVSEAGIAGGLAGVTWEAGFVALTILWIIYPALCIHELQVRSGAVSTLQNAIGRLSRDPLILVILVAWFFALFMEGVAGFGTAVALSAPFLVSAGFGPVQAVMLTMVGHTVGVSFGAVGTPVLPQIAMSGFRGVELSAATGNYHALIGWLMPFTILLLLQRSGRVGAATLRSAAGWMLLAAACFFLPYFLLARYVGPELPTLAGALFGGVMFVAFQSFAARRLPVKEQGGESSLRETIGAASPYLILVSLILLTRLIVPVREALREVTIGWRYLEVFEGSMEVLYHPGTSLMIAFLAAALLRGVSPGELGRVLFVPVRQLAGVSIALLAMLGLSRLMVHSGMVDVLASAAAAGAGGAWPLFAPLVGVLGTFVTGSATASNILLSEFQIAAGRELSLPVLPLLGAQGFGAAVGNIICPHNIIAAGATVNLAGQEGRVLARTAAVALGYALLGGVLALLVFVR